MSTDERVEGVWTGAPEVCMLACTACGVLLWDIDAHYAHAHTDRTVGASEGSEDTVRPADDPDVHQVDSEPRR